MDKKNLEYEEQVNRLTKELKASESRFVRIVEENPDGIIIVNHEGIICFMNTAAERLFSRKADKFLGTQFGLPIFDGERTEISIDQGKGNKKIAEVRVVETKWEGAPAYLATLRDITVQWQMRKKLEQTNNTLNQTIDELKTANQLIVQQQGSVIEEERLTLLLQMAGAIAHDLNQPLMALLGNIELMRLAFNDNKEKKEIYLDRIEDAGQRISHSVKKIQHIRQHETIQHDSRSTIINLNQIINMLILSESDKEYNMLKNLLKDNNQINFTHAVSIEKSVQLLNQIQYDAIIAFDTLCDENAYNLLKKMVEKQLETPVIVIAGNDDEDACEKFIKTGASECIYEREITPESFMKKVDNTLEKCKQKKEMKNTLKTMSGLSNINSQTLMYNRLYFMESLDREIERTKRNQTEFVVYMLVMDQFDKYSSTHYQTDSNNSFSKYGIILKNSLRKSDLICRYSNEEFGMILPDTPGKNSNVASNRIDEIIAVYNQELEDQPLLPKVGIGKACYSLSDPMSSFEIVSQAKQAAFLLH